MNTSNLQSVIVPKSAPVGIPTNLQPATAAAFAAIPIAVMAHAKAGAKLIAAIKAAKVAAMVDPRYLTGSAMVNGKSQKMADLRAIAADLVATFSDVHAASQAAAVKASAAKKFADSRDRAAFERSQMKPVLDAIQYAKNSVIDLVGGSQQSRITYDGKAKAYVITAAPDAGKSPEVKKDAPAAKDAPAKGKAAPAKTATDNAIAAFDAAPGAVMVMLREGFLSKSLRVSFGENPDAARLAIIAAAMEIEAAVTALQPRKS